MDAILNPVEIRVLGALIEKQLSTPEYYPLSLNALINACNQLSNREPVVSYDEETVLKALDTLRKKGLVRVISGPDMRVPKYAQAVEDFFSLAIQEIAVLCVLMLRGAQTIGEIRGRSGRLYEFADLSEVELTIQGLVDRNPQALVIKLARQPGTKESRYSHLLGGMVEVEQKINEKINEKVNEKLFDITQAEKINSNENERISKLEKEVEELKEQILKLSQEFSDFKKQFE